VHILEFTLILSGESIKFLALKKKPLPVERHLLAMLNSQEILTAWLDLPDRG